MERERESRGRWHQVGAAGALAASAALLHLLLLMHCLQLHPALLDC